MVRYENSTTGHHYYSTVSDPPSGFSGATTIGHVHTTGGSGLVELYRHYNSTTGDYLINTSSAPPGGYVMQALLGYGHTSGVISTQQNLAYTYDEVGNIKTITDAIWSGSRSFNYDDLNRLKQATGTFGQNQAQVTHDYTYDAIGNILSKAGVSYCYGYMASCPDSNRLSGVKTTSDGGTYSYDANGNIESGGGRSYTWNADNRLDQVTGPGGTAVMTYDYTGIRVKKSGTSGTTLFPFTGYEFQSGTVTKFIRIGNEIIASKQGTSTKRFYHNDHLGGVNIISDINGNQAQLTEYDPWGKVSRMGDVADLTHRFTGQELDSESDIHYYGGRYYDQGLGRFISPDPIVPEPGDPHNLNRYAYVINNPQIYTDPTGHWPEWMSNWDWISGAPSWGSFAAANSNFGFQDNSSSWLTRISGGLQALGGLSQAIAGGAACATLVGCAVGGPAAVLGADQFYAGIQKMGTGREVDTYLSKGIQWTSILGQTGANYLDAGINIVSSLGVAAAPKIVSAVENWTLQRLVTKTAAELASDPAGASILLKSGEINALNANPGLTNAFFGTTVERAVAGKIAGPGESISWLSRPGLSTPDFASSVTGKFYDVTSNSARSIANHLDRSYFLDGSTKLLTYPRLATGWRFK